MPPTLGMGAVTAAVMAAADFTGGLSGHGKPAEMDEFERKEQLRLNRRRPIEETIAEIGEGRGKCSSWLQHYVVTSHARWRPC